VSTTPEKRSVELLNLGLHALMRHDFTAADTALVRMEHGEGSPHEYRQLLEAFRREVMR
jgi:hypothetical protein